MKFIFFILMFVSLFTYANSDFGIWGTTCDDDGFSIHLNSEPSPLVINDNQIVISVRAKRINSKVIDVFFVNTLDLGSGGIVMNWDNIDRNIKIAELTYENNKGVMKWFGFSDKKKHNYVWVKEPDFIQSYAKNSVIDMKKCEE